MNKEARSSVTEQKNVNQVSSVSVCSLFKALSVSCTTGIIVLVIYCRLVKNSLFLQKSAGGGGGVLDFPKQFYAKIREEKTRNETQRKGYSLIARLVEQKEPAIFKRNQYFTYNTAVCRHVIYELRSGVYYRVLVLYAHQ